MKTKKTGPDRARGRMKVVAGAILVILVGLVCALAWVTVPTGFPNPDAEQEKDAKFWHDSNRRALERRLRLERREGRANNVILFVGDGMGMSTITAARIFKGQLAGESGENATFSFENFPHTSLAKVYCVDRMVPDSACSGTAMQCGVKTNYFTVGVSASVTMGNCTQSSNPRNHLKCLYDWAQEYDKSTGFVTTAEVTDATASSGYAKTAHREWESDTPKEFGTCLDIAHQLVHRAPGINLRFIAGGGRAHFEEAEKEDPSENRGKRNDHRNLIAEWKSLKQGDRMHAAYCSTWEDVRNIDADVTETVLALLSDGELPFENLDDIKKGESLLAKLTEQAIRVLKKNPDGFLLVVEAGQIDKGHHLTEPLLALTEVLSLDLAVAKAQELTTSDDTLIVVTADHGHAFTMGGKARRGANIFGLDDRPELMTVLNYAAGPGYRDSYHNLTLRNTAKKGFAFPSVYKTRLGVHSGEDVPVFAVGPYAHLFSGVHEQTYISEVIK